MTTLNPYFGEFGGMYVPQILMPALKQLEEAFVSAQLDPELSSFSRSVKELCWSPDRTNPVSEFDRWDKNQVISET